MKKKKTTSKQNAIEAFEEITEPRAPKTLRGLHWREKAYLESY